MKRTAGDSPPHVALAIGALWDVSGGAERVLTDVANGLHRRGWNVTVMTYQERNGPSFYPLDFGITRLDGRRRHSRRRKPPPLIALRSASRRRPLVGLALWVITYIPRVLALRRMLRIARPDVAVGFMPSTFPYLVLAGKLTRTPTIASIHNVPDRELGGDPDRWDPNVVDVAVRRWSVRAADGVTVLLEGFVDEIDANARSRTYVVPNMIVPYTGRRAVVGTEAKNRILAVGRFAKAKDHETLIRAWALVEERHPDWYVEIYGRGPLRSQLSGLIENLGLRRLQLCDPTSEIYDVYTSSKFVVMPSIHEGFGLVTVEAMTCGLPVIGFADCEGTNEIVIDGENGLLIDPGADRVSALADGIERLITDEDLRVRLARTAPKTIDRFSPDVVMDIWEQVLTEVGGTASPGSRDA